MYFAYLTDTAVQFNLQFIYKCFLYHYINFRADILYIFHPALHLTFFQKPQQEVITLKKPSSFPHCSNQVEVHFLPKDAVHGKENRRRMKDSASAMSKYQLSTLQEKNDHLVSISSDSDMEIVGLRKDPKHSLSHLRASKSGKLRTKKKKKRSRSDQRTILSPERIEELSTADIETYLIDHIEKIKTISSSRSRHKLPSPPRFRIRSPLVRELPRSPRKRKIRAMRSASPTSRLKSPILERRLPRRRRSPRRSPSRSPVRSYASARERESSSSQTDEMHALLKKVRRLESVGTRSPKDNSYKSKEHSSLKEKLDNMMNKKSTHSKSSSPPPAKTKGAINNNDSKLDEVASTRLAPPADDDDDIEVLRRLALETKQKKTEESIKQKAEIMIADENLSDDNDSEANELRLIALHSAIIKKHQERVKRGVKSKRPINSETRVESPFNDNFLDDIPMPNDKASDDKSPVTESPNLEGGSHSVEDMDLDTDVEREKDSMSYSPTDDLTIIAESPSIQQSHPLPASEIGNMLLDRTQVTHGIDTPYFSSVLTQTPVKNNKFSSRSDIKVIAPSSPASSDCVIVKNVSYSPILDDRHDSLVSIDTTKNNKSHFKHNREIPYSPTDTPVYDPELASMSLTEIANGMGKEAWSELTENDFELSSLHRCDLDISAARILMSTMSDDDIESSFTEISEISSHENCPYLTDAKEPFDRLPDVDLDGSPLVPVSKGLETPGDIIPLATLPELVDTSEEPLYLQGLPDVTKDANKVPTLVDKSQVPVAILKAHKELQQPMPNQKLETHAEPSFKTAAMRPVNIDMGPSKSTTLFKPLKLCPVAKKPQVIHATDSAFNTASGEDSVKEIDSDESNVIVEPLESVKEQSTTTLSPKISSPVKKKIKLSRRQRGRRSRDDEKDESLSLEHKRIEKADKRDTLDKASLSKGNKSNASRKRRLEKSPNKLRVIEKGTADGKPKRCSSIKVKEDISSVPNTSESLGSFESLVNFKNKDFSTDSAQVSSLLTKTCEDRSSTIFIKGIETSKTKEHTESIDLAEKKRRLSLEEDDEALRALLLASLAKRTKPAEPVSTSIPSNQIVISRIPKSGAEMSVENLTSKKELAMGSSNSVVTPLKPVALSSQSHIVSDISHVEASLSTDLPNDTLSAKNITEPVNKVEPSRVSPRKRTITSPMKGPAKKIVKKALPVLASTRVVNNAKKYQNAILQRKLNLQKAELLKYRAQNSSRNITLNNLKKNEVTRPTSPKITANSKMQRLVINLESDSDSELDTEEETLSVHTTTGDATTQTRESAEIPSKMLEISVMQFLKDQRKKVESVAALSSNATLVPTSSKTPVSLGTSTPETRQNIEANLDNTPLVRFCNFFLCHC